MYSCISQHTAIHCKEKRRTKHTEQRNAGSNEMQECTRQFAYINRGMHQTICISLLGVLGPSLFCPCLSSSLPHSRARAGSTRSGAGPFTQMTRLSTYSCISGISVCLVPLRVDFLLKTDSGCPRDAEVTFFTLSFPLLFFSFFCFFFSFTPDTHP